MKIKVTTRYDKWFNGLKDNKAKAKIAVRITRIKTGNFGDSKSAGAGVSELVIDHGPGYRVYFGRKGNELVVIIAGSTKKNQQQAINNAKELWKEIKKQ